MKSRPVGCSVHLPRVASGGGGGPAMWSEYTVYANQHQANLYKVNPKSTYTRYHDWQIAPVIHSGVKRPQVVFTTLPGKHLKTNHCGVGARGGAR